MEEKEEKKVLQFASIEEMVTTTKPKTTTTYSKDDVEMYLGNPYKYHAKLREVSDWFYFNNGIYRNIINAVTALPTLDNMIIPTAKTMTKVEDKSYTTYYDKVNNYSDSINIKTTTRNILKSIARYGSYIGYERSEGNEFTFQTLPLDYCRIKYKVGHDYQVEFNFKYFDKFWNKEDVDLAWVVYPPEFKKLYNKFKADKKSKNPEWQLLDIKKTFVVLFDDDEPFAIPMFSGMFEALLNNEEYKEIIKIGQKLDISKLIVQKVPTDKDGNIAIPRELMSVLHQALKLAIPEHSNALTTPLEVHDVNFTNQQQSKEDLLKSAERGAFVSGGWSSGMFADNGGITGLNMNVEIVTANIYAILERIEECFSRKFKNVANSKNYEFKLKIFRTTNINITENFDRMYKLLEIGGAISPILAISGMDTESYVTLLQMENMLKIKDNLVIPESIHTQSAKGQPSGQPPKADKNLTDSGAKSKDNGNNKVK